MSSGNEDTEIVVEPCKTLLGAVKLDQAPAKKASFGANALLHHFCYTVLCYHFKKWV